MQFDFQAILGISAGVVAFIAYIAYFISIVKGETKPHRVTWWIWSFMGLVLAVSYYASGAFNTIWSPFVEFIGPFIVALLSIKYGEGGIEDKSDIVCFLGGVLSVILWVIFDNPVLALILGLLIDFFALFPTIKKSYLRPHGEDFWAWIGTTTADFINILAIETFTFAVIVLPIYMFVNDIIIVGILFFRRNMLKKGWHYILLSISPEKNIYYQKSKIHHRGIFAKRAIQEGEVIGKIRGTIQYKKNQTERDARDNPDWVGFKIDYWVDPIPPYKYLNHSCNPNAGIRENRNLIARRDIDQGEEIHIDYSTTEIDSLWRMEGVCNCGSEGCRKIICSIQTLPRDVFSSYLPYIPKDFQKIYYRSFL